LRHLEVVNDALITPTEFTEAITKVQKENGAEMTLAQTRALVKTIYNQRDERSTGALSRIQIREAMEASIDKLMVLKYSTLPADDSIVVEVLNYLEQCQGRSITLSEVMKAIQMVARRSETELTPRLLDDTCSSLFSAETLKVGIISRTELRETLLRNKSALHDLIR
jgi:hypothetical protein